MKTYKKVIIVLLVIIALLGGFSGWMLYSMKNVVDKTAKEISASLSQNEGVNEVNEVPAALKLYQYIFNQLEEYGLESEYGEQSAQLANTLLDATLKQYTINEIEYLDNGLIVNVTGTGVNIQNMDEAWVQKIVAKAAGKYLVGNILDISKNLLFNDQKSLEQSVYTHLGSDIFDTMEQEIASLPEGPVNFDVIITYSGDKTTFEIQSNNS